MKKVYAIQYVLYNIVNGVQEIKDIRIQGVYSNFDGTDSAVEALRSIARVYDLYVPCGGDEVAIYGDNACFTVIFDKDGRVIDSYFRKDAYETMKFRKQWYTVSLDIK